MLFPCFLFYSTQFFPFTGVPSTRLCPKVLFSEDPMINPVISARIWPLPLHGFVHVLPVYCSKHTLFVHLLLALPRIPVFFPQSLEQSWVHSMGQEHKVHQEEQFRGHCSSSEKPHGEGRDLVHIFPTGWWVQSSWEGVGCKWEGWLNAWVGNIGEGKWKLDQRQGENQVGLRYIFWKYSIKTSRWVDQEAEGEMCVTASLRLLKWSIQVTHCKLCTVELCSVT